MQAFNKKEKEKENYEASGKKQKCHSRDNIRYKQIKKGRLWVQEKENHQKVVKMDKETIKGNEMIKSKRITLKKFY